MRSVAIIDLKIDKDEALALLDEYSEYIEKHTGLEHEFWVERRDFSQVPTTIDSDGDVKPTEAYRRQLFNDVHSRYGDDGTDNVIMWVHEDNFIYKGIWGQNWSYVYGTYSMHLCRWDRDNDVNTFNTLFHEQAHSWDRLILEEIGVDIEPLAEEQLNLSNFDYDRDFVHGNSSHFPYIGKRGFTRENKDTVSMLTFLAPYLQRAYAVRKERHMKKLGMLNQIVKLLSTVVSLLSKKIK
jgi:hypothetical protein